MFGPDPNFVDYCMRADVKSFFPIAPMTLQVTVLTTCQQLIILDVTTVSLTSPRCGDLFSKDGSLSRTDKLNINPACMHYNQLQ